MIKIDKVTIRGFKKIEKAEVELSPGTNLFLGHNETGKTSLQEAITYVLTDSIHNQPKKDFAEMVNDQSKIAAVTVEGTSEDNAFEIKRTLAKTSRSGPSPIQIGAQLNVDPHVLLACLNANYYFDLSPDDQKKLIIKALGLKPTEQDATDILVGAGYDSETWNAGIIQEIGALGWDAGYKLAYSSRRLTGQTIKALKESQPKLLTQVAMGDKQVPIDVIMKTHKETPLPVQEEKHRASLKKLYEEVGGIKALSEADKKEAERQLEEYQTEKAEIVKTTKWTKGDTTEGNRLKKAKSEFDAKVKEDVAALENLAETTENLLAENKKKWKSTLKCPVSDKSGYEMCPAIEPNWSQQQEEIEGIETRIRAVEEKTFPEQKQWDDLSEKAAKCKDNIAQDTMLTKNVERLREELASAEPEGIEKKKELETTIAEIEQKVDHLRLGQSAITWNKATQETLGEIQVKIDEAEAEREYYDQLCKLLAPDGIPGELVAKKLGPLNTRLAEHAEMMGVEVLFLDDLDLVQAGNKQIWTLGGAETSRVKMAVAEAISHVTGVGLLLLDECNISVAADNARVKAWLVKMGQTTQIVAAAATNAAGPPNVPKNAPVQMFWVEKGNIARL